MNKFIYIGLYILLVCCDLSTNGAEEPMKEEKPLTVVSNISDEEFNPGFIASFIIRSDLEDKLNFKLELLSPENEDSWNPLFNASFINNEEEVIDYEIPDVFCKNACYFRLAVWDNSELILLDTTITINIRPLNFDNENRFFPTSVENSYVYIRNANRWDGPKLDPVSISNGYISVDSFDNLNALDFKVRNSEGRIESFLRTISLRDHGFFFTRFSSDLYRLDINKYDSTFFYLDDTDIAIPFSTNSDDYFFSPEGYGPFIRYMGDESVSLGEKSFEAKKFKGGHLFTSYEITFVKHIGIYRYKSYFDGGEDEFILKGAVIDGVVYGDTSKVIN